jgi:hypothetical protein
MSRRYFGITPLRNLVTSGAALCIFGIACMNGSAQTLTLDSFESGHYSKLLNGATTQDTHYAPLPAGSPLGQARETVFTLAPGPYGLPSTLVVEKVAGTPPAGDLAGYPAFRINFAALSGSDSLTMLMEVYVGTQIYASPGVPDFSDIDYILIETEGGNTSFGVTSFEAVT